VNNRDYIKNSRVLLLGSTGFIGSHILEELINRLAIIVLPVRNISSLPEKILRFTNHKSVTFIDYDAFIKDPLNFDCDFIINALGYGLEPTNRNFLEMFYINSFLPVLLMDKLQDNSTCMVHLGSGSEYLSSNGNKPYIEEDKKTDKGLYALSKKFSSEYLKEVASNISMPIVSIRLFNVFGPGEKQHRLFPSIYSKLSKNEEVNLSDGNQICDFLFIKDAVNAILHVANVCKRKNLIDEVNICSGEGISVKDFAENVAKKMNVDCNLLKFGKIPRRDTDNEMFVGNADKLLRVYGWKKKYNINSGIDKYIEHLIK
jgi:nucleoside-diphosphate-sugar epimerase